MKSDTVPRVEVVNMIQKLCDSFMNNQLGWQVKPAQEITA